MNLISSAFSIMVPILLASLGGLFSELAGMLNIALEGMMAIGAFSTVVFANASGSFFLGVIAGLLLTVGLSALFGFVTLKLKANPFIAGLATNLLAGGLCTVISDKIFGTEGVVALSNLKALHTINFPVPSQNIFLFIAVFGVILTQIVIKRTPYGLHLRACGQNSEALKSLGLEPDFYRFSSFLISGAFCALGGASIMLNFQAYVPNATSGRGWIALVLVFLGNRKPAGLMIAAFVFALADSFSNFAQGFWNIPADFILAIPYLVTLAAMILYSVMERKHKEFK